MDSYQRIVFLPGQVLALIMFTGLAGLVLPRRRTAVAALLWVSAAILIVLPIAEHEYTYRYVLPAVPLACVAAAIVFAARRDQPAPAAAPAEPSAPDHLAAPEDGNPPAPDRPESVSPA